MTKPLTVFADPVLGVIEILRDGLEGRLEDYVDDFRVGAKIPKVKALELDGLPYLLVAADAAFPRYPVDENVTVRVTIWHRTDFDAMRLAQLARGLVLSTPGTAYIRSTSGLTGPAPAVDPDTGERMATFTVSVHTRPTPV